MQAKELQIGDWVKAKDIEYAQVSFIDQYGDIGLDMQDESKNPFQEQDIESIPLTEEILKANGFVRSGLFMSKYWNELDIIYPDGSFDNHIDITTCGNDYHSEYINIRLSHKGIGMPLYYVHELQHVLRLCGLWDMADNFKV